MKLLWLQRRGVGDHRLAATASFFSEMLMFPRFQQHFRCPQGRRRSGFSYEPYWPPEPLRSSATVWGTCTETECIVERMQLKHDAACKNCNRATRVECLFYKVDSANCKLKASQLTTQYTCRFLGAKKRHANLNACKCQLSCEIKMQTGESVTE